MSPDDRGIDHQPIQVGIRSQGLEDPIQDTALDPVIVAPLDPSVVAEALRQVAPARARARHP